MKRAKKVLLSIFTAIAGAGESADAQEFALKASSFLGGDGDEVRAVRIASDGAILLAANLAAAEVAGMPIVPLTVQPGAKGFIVRLGPDGGKVLRAVRVAAAIHDMSLDPGDAVYTGFFVVLEGR